MLSFELGAQSKNTIFKIESRISLCFQPIRQILSQDRPNTSTTASIFSIPTSASKMVRLGLLAVLCSVGLAATVPVARSGRYLYTSEGNRFYIRCAQLKYA